MCKNSGCGEAFRTAGGASEAAVRSMSGWCIGRQPVLRCAAVAGGELCAQRPPGRGSFGRPPAVTIPLSPCCDAMSGLDELDAQRKGGASSGDPAWKVVQGSGRAWRDLHDAPKPDQGWLGRETEFALDPVASGARRRPAQAGCLRNFFDCASVPRGSADRAGEAAITVLR